MPTYAYKARDNHGISRTDTMEAESVNAAIAVLRGDGLTVTDIKLGKSVIDVSEVRRRQAARSVKREDVIGFTSQLSIMLETGVPISDALDAYLEQTKKGSLPRIIEVVADQINSGVSFSSAISEFPRVFPPLMISLVKAAEATGDLGGMLGRVSSYMAQDFKTLKQVKGALTYPVVMIGMAFTVTGFLVAWVLPRFAKIYEGRDAVLPLPTRVLLGISDTVAANLIPIVVGLIALTVSVLLFRASNRGRETVDWLKIHAPIMGPIFRNFYMARATRTLSTLLSAGIALPDAIAIIRGVTNNRLWERLWDAMEHSMAGGGTIGEIVVASPLLPPSYARIISAGERTGRLPFVFDKVATVSEEDLDEQIKVSTQLIEPIVITFMGVMIGGIAIALLMPIFSMGSVMTQ